MTSRDANAQIFAADNYGRDLRADDFDNLFRALYNDRVLAHQVLFKKRHPNITPEFHRELINLWHSDERHVLWMVFRGGAKSTIAEEGFIIGAGFREFRNGLIIGDTFDRASERLQAIKHEIDTNDALANLFGPLHGAVWADDEIVLANGVRILAMGRGQSIRGIKFNDSRPDFFFCDDLENAESVRTPEARDKTLNWLVKELLPACDPKHKGRMAATPLDPESVPMLLARPGSGWTSKVFPIEHIDAQGMRTPTWPDRFALKDIDRLVAAYQRLGKMREYRMEYMCQAEHAEDKTFKSEMFRTEARVRTWEAVFAMFDPARTTGPKSAMTGFAAWSWIGEKLQVWDAWGRYLMPDEIVKAVFECNDTYAPTLIGVEEDGLNEFLLQPIRHEAMRKQVMLPLKPMRAPRGKLDFIRGLQPFFNARFVQFAKDMPDLKSQLLAFPTGLIDVPNALAYAPLMRPGAPMYEDFANRHVAEDMNPLRGKTAYLCVNATRAFVSAALVQYMDGALRIYADWMREGEPSLIIKDIVREAYVEAGQSCRLVAPPQQFDQYTNTGLVQSARGIPSDIRKGTDCGRGRPFLRNLLVREFRGLPALMVDARSRWVLNGLAGGYARVLQKQGMLADYAEEGPYRVLMEGIESFCGLLNIGNLEDDSETDETHWATNARGLRYRTALGNR